MERELIIYSFVSIEFISFRQSSNNLIKSPKVSRRKVSIEMVVTLLEIYQKTDPLNLFMISSGRSEKSSFSIFFSIGGRTLR